MAKTKIDAENIRSRFGPKLPNGKNENPIFAMMDLVVGAMSAIGWGNPKRNYKDLNGLLNDKPHNIYHLINDIKESLDPTKIKKGSLLSYMQSNNDILKDIKTAIISNKNDINQQNQQKKLNISLEQIEIGEDVLFILKSKIEDYFNLDNNSILLSVELDQNRLEARFETLKGQVYKDILGVYEDIIDKSLEKINNSITTKFNSADFDLNGFSENLKNKLKDILDPLNISISLDQESITNLENQFKSIDIGNIVSSVNDVNDILSEIFDKLNDEYVINIDVEDSIENLNKLNSKNIEELRKQLGEEKPLYKLIKSISDLKVDGKNLKNLNIISNFISSILSALNIKKINVKIIDDISSLTTTDGALTKLLNNLQNRPYTNEINKNIIKNINNAESLFDALLKLVELKYKDIKKSEKTLNYINGDYFNNIKKIIEHINELYIYSNKVDINDKIYALKSIIETIPQIASLSIFDMLWSRISIKYLNDYIKKDIVSIFNTLNEILKKYNDSYKNIEQISLCINSLISIFNIDQQKLEDSEEKIDLINDLISNNINNLIKQINELFKEDILNEVIFNVENIEVIFEKINELNDILPSLISLITSNLKISLLSNEFDLINNILHNIKNENINSLLIDEKIKDIENFGYLVLSLDDLNKLLSNINIAKALVNLIKIKIEFLMINGLISTLPLFEKISLKGLDILDKYVQKIIDINEKFKNVDTDGINRINELLKTLMKVVVGSITIFLIVGIAMNYIDPLALIGFTFALSTFIFSLLWTYSKISKESLESSFNTAYDLALLIAISGGTMIFGSLLFHFINLEDLLGFSAMLLAFISGIMFVYSKLSKGIKKSFNAAFDLGLLIAISGGTMIFGSLLFHFINFEDLIGFTFSLGVFIFGLLGIYALFNKSFKYALAGAKDFAILLGVSAGLMILGGLLADWFEKKYLDILLFGVELMGFTILIGAPWILGSQMFKHALKGAKEFAILITVSAALMILGPYLVHKLAEDIGEKHPYFAMLKFAVILGLFVIGVGYALKLASLNEKKSLMAAIGLSVVIGVCAYALIYGPVYMKDNGVDFYTDVIPFAIGLLVFTVLMGGIIALLGQMDWSTLIKGTLCVVVIGLITLGAAYVMTEFYNAVKNINHNVLLKGIFKTGEVFGAFAALICGLGVFVTGPQAAVLGAGAAALGVLEGLVWGAAKVIDAIALSMKHLNETASLMRKEQFEHIYDIIKCFGTTLTLLADKISLKTAGKLTAIMPSILMGVAGLSMIGNVIKDWANMWVPDIDSKTGKTKGYRKLYNADIQNAGNNIGKVLTAIGTAIKEVIGDPNNKEIFSEGLFKGKSPFRVAMESFKYSGQILSSIAQGIKDWSSMAIPTGFDNTGKPKGYTSLNDDILGHAQENIQKVLLGIGLAIANVVKQDTNNIFKLGKNSPAIIAAEAISTTSKALTNIVAILQKFASKDFETVVNKLHGIDEKHPGIIDNITKTLTGIVDIINLFLKPVEGTGIIWDDSFAEYLNKNKNELINAKDTISEFANTVISIFGSIGSIGESYMMYEQNIKYIADKNKSGIIYGALLHIKVLFNKLVDINRTLTGYNLNINTMLNSFDQFSKMLILYVESAERFDENTNKNLDLLINGIIKLYTTTSKWGTNNVFTQYVQDVKDFVKSINDLNIDKLSTMNNLISAMSELATKLGNVDGLIDALANKLAPIIVELVTQLQKAEATIKNAHELQRVRKDLIDNSVKKVKELMDQHMIVEVLRGDDSGNTPTISSGGGNNYQGGSNNTPTNNDAETPLESPEDAGQQQATGSAEKVKSENSSFMLMNILDELKQTRKEQKQFFNY